MLIGSLRGLLSLVYKDSGYLHMQTCSSAGGQSRARLDAEQRRDKAAMLCGYS